MLRAVSACLLGIATVVAAAACGEERNGKTFRDGGLSFTYPPEWRERISGPGLAGFTYVVEVGSRKRRYAVVDVRIEPAGIRVNGKNVPITKETSTRTNG